ncbi:MAG: A24 family peptidase [Bdellovibrio sp.]
MIGSFLNVVIYRMPLERSVITPRSSCPKCKTIIPWYQNIPVFSYLFLQGKCAYCNESFSPRYLFVELLTGILFVVVTVLNFPISNFPIWIIQLALISAFICHFFIDLEHHLLLDKINLFILILALLNMYLSNGWFEGLLGALIGFGFPLGISFVFLKLRNQQGLGGGDIKFFGVLGLLLGPYGILLNIFLSSFIGSIVAGISMMLGRFDRNRPFAFGPYIILISVLQIFAPELMARLTSFLYS